MKSMLAFVAGLLLVNSGSGCTISAKGYGDSGCAVPLGSDSWTADAGECFANNVGGYSSYKCLKTTEIEVDYFASSSDCKAGSNPSSEADYVNGKCTYSDERGLYVTMTLSSDCCTSDISVIKHGKDSNETRNEAHLPVGNHN